MHNWYHNIHLTFPKKKHKTKQKKLPKPKYQPKKPQPNFQALVNSNYSIVIDIILNKSFSFHLLFK